MISLNNAIWLFMATCAVFTICILQYRGDTGLAWFISTISTSALVISLMFRPTHKAKKG